jgi:hypothetical protein
VLLCTDILCVQLHFFVRVLRSSHKAARASPAAAAAAAATGTKRKDSASSSSEDAAKSITLRVKTTGDGREYKVPVR